MPVFKSLSSTTLCAILMVLLFPILRSYGQEKKNYTVFDDTFYNAGFPFIHNYSPKDYNGHGQCWGVAQGLNGLMYYGNSEGVLQYDGSTWNFLQLPNHSIVRNISLAEDNNLYCSGNGEIGYLVNDSTGAMEYISLVPKLPEGERDFNDIWDVEQLGNKVFFNTFKKLLIWDMQEQRFTVKPAPTAYGNVYRIRDEIWVTSAYEGILKYQDNTLVPLNARGELDGRAFGICALDEERTMVQYDEGIFLYENNEFRKISTDIDHLLPEMFILRATRLDQNHFVLIASNNGLFIMRDDGTLIKHISAENGLLSSNMHDAFVDHNNTLWITSNYGISKIEVNLPIRRFDTRNKIEDTVNDILRYRDTLYISTHSGLFYLSEEQGSEFKSVGAPLTEVMALEVVNDQLLLSCPQGLFLKNRGMDFKQLTNTYTYKFQQSIRDPNLLFIGSTEGLFTLAIDNNQFKVLKSYANQVPYDIRSLEQDVAGNLWLGTTRGNLYKVDFFNDGTPEAPVVIEYDQKDGLPQGGVEVHRINDHMVFSSEYGVHEMEGDRMVVSPNLPPFRDMVHKVSITSQQILYALHDRPPFMKVSGYRKTGDFFEPQNYPELPYIASAGIWVTYEDEDGSIWFGMTDGVLNYRPLSYSVGSDTLFTNISSVKLNTDSIVVKNISAFEIPHSALEGRSTFNYDNNNIRFEYALPSFANEFANEFQYKLDGLDDDWSAWTTEKVKEYVGLFEGTYSFKVRGRNIQNILGTDAVYTFVILPPWYRTWWFLSISALLILTTLGVIIRYFSQKKLLARVRELELEQKIQLERERISSDLHDHVGAQLTSIISGLSITEQIKELRDNPKLKDLVDSLQEDARSTMVNLRDSIWSLNMEAISAVELIDHIENFLESYLKYHPHLEYSIHSDIKQASIVGPTKGLHVTRTIQEAIQNIVKHSDASTIELSVTSRGEKLDFEVYDDGQGFDVGSIDGEHYGIQNMTKRVSDIGGQLKIDSSPGQGTRLTFSV